MSKIAQLLSHTVAHIAATHEPSIGTVIGIATLLICLLVSGFSVVHALDAAAVITH